MIEFDTQLLEVIERTPGVKSFRFKAERDADFKAGQFFFVTIKIDGEEATKHFSFSNSPTEKGYIEFTKKMTGSKFSEALENLKPGDWAHLRMPFGSFVFEGEYGKIAFLSGGIGITPIRSICKYATDIGLSTDMILLYGNGTEEEITFRGDLDALESVNDNLRVVYTLTSPQAGGEGWTGRTGLIDSKMIREEVPDFMERVFYVCGPPAMVSSLKGILKNDLSVPEDKIKIENFPGY